MERDLDWRLLFTKPRAEAWAEMHLRKQGLPTLLPRVHGRQGFVPLFPRYLFVGAGANSNAASMLAAPGVMYQVHRGDRPARVPRALLDALQAAMDPRGVVQLEILAQAVPALPRTQRERVRALLAALEDVAPARSPDGLVGRSRCLCLTDAPSRPDAE